MPKKSPKPPPEWDRVLVRHLMASRRDELSRLDSLLHVPFHDSSRSSASGGGEAKIYGFPSGRWMLAAHFAGQDWGALFTNHGTNAELFEGNAKNRRLEVAWIGYREAQGGWFVKVRRGGKAVVDFSQPPGEAEPKLKAKDLPAELLADSAGGEESFRRLCEHFGLAPKQMTIEADRRSFQVIGLRGKPVKTGLMSYILYHGPEIAEGENPAAERLEKAIDRRDPERIRKAIAEGASLEYLPDSSVSPLMSALYKCPKKGWEECARLLIELGASVHGTPDDDPLVVSASQSFVPEHNSLPMLKFLVEHGADVNATGRIGESALFNAVVHRRIPTIQFLLEHGADPHLEASADKTIIEWLKSRIKDDQRRGFSEYAEILKLLTGEEVEQPGLLKLTDELKRENQRIEECRTARQLLGMFSPPDVHMTKTPRDFLMRLPKYDQWTKELKEAGYQKAGAFEIQLGQLATSVTAFVHEELGFDAVLIQPEFLANRLRLEIAATLENGRMLSVANEKAATVLSYKSPFSDCETVSKATVKKLTDRLKKRIESEDVPIRPAKLEMFAERFQEFQEQDLKELRAYLENVLETPAIFVNGRPARYERLGCYLDIVSQKNPAWTTATIAENALEDLTEVETAKVKDSFQLKLAIHSAADLLAMGHLQFAGASSSDDFIGRGAEIAVRYFEAQTRRSKPFQDDYVVDELLQGLLLNMLADRWDGVSKICTALTPAFAASKHRMSDDPPRELAKLFLIVASHFRERSIRGTAELANEIRKSRRAHPKLLLKVWEAIEAEDQAAFEKGFEKSLEQTVKDVPTADRFYDLRRFLAWPESILLLIAKQRGLSRPRLPEHLADRLLVAGPEKSQGLSRG